MDGIITGIISAGLSFCRLEATMSTRTISNCADGNVQYHSCNAMSNN